MISPSIKRADNSCPRGRARPGLPAASSRCCASSRLHTVLSPWHCIWTSTTLCRPSLFCRSFRPRLDTLHEVPRSTYCTRPLWFPRTCPRVPYHQASQTCLDDYPTEKWPGLILAASGHGRRVLFVHRRRHGPQVSANTADATGQHSSCRVKHLP